jgi:HNH endonuclease
MTDRIALSKRVRFEVFKRDRFCCQYCGRHPPDIVLEIDHIIPVCDGGDIKFFNEKIGLAQVLEAAEIAAAKWLGPAQEDEWRTQKQRRFAYFCGVCWHKIKGQSHDEGDNSS